MVKKHKGYNRGYNEPWQLILNANTHHTNKA